MTGRQAPVLAARRVLVVDDERSVAAAVARRLEKDGAQCLTSYTGAEALKLLEGGGIDLLVTDVRMPEKSGLELMEAALMLEEPPAVILMAADGDIGVADALSRGADGFVRKPFDVDLVAHEAALAVELRGLRKAGRASAASRGAGSILVVLGEIVAAFEKADPYRAGYSSRTARIVTQIAKPLGLDGEVLSLAARIHDVGMLAVPIAEQHAEGAPDRTSQHLIRVHPTLGARWIERLGAERVMVAAVAAHHERWDGQGYPGGLAGDQIPPEARALGLAAAIAAMAGPRPWREKLDAATIIEQVSKGRGTQFGAAEADAALELLRKAPIIIG